ncbi:unnamed protein product [Mytilus edulis]|uniref:Uncharacterized protein n=1 Tax=Mytilus edulis TaxID=6550 RepID=A0A8S3PSH6_MYTED|nr:unnamed protein product [Mytilus edulis]
MHSDPGDNVIVESVVTLLRGFVIENKEVVRRALKENMGFSMNIKGGRYTITNTGVYILSLTSLTGLEDPQLSLRGMIKRLIEMNKPVINDDRQNKYCSYIMRFLSYFSGERCMVAGSTQEQTRLRIRQDEGDFDYLIISAISIPVSALENREDLPCFVHINGL